MDSKIMPKIKNYPRGNPTILETKQKLDAYIQKKLADGVSALTKQRHVVSDLYQSVLNDILSTKRNEGIQKLIEWVGNKDNRVALSDIISCYSRQIHNIIGNEEIYPSIEKEIETKSRAILQQLQKDVLMYSDDTSSKKVFPGMCFIVQIAEQDNTLHIKCGLWSVSGTFDDAETLFSRFVSYVKSEIANIQDVRSHSAELQIHSKNLRYVQIADLRDKLKAVLGSESKITDSFLKNTDI